MTDAEALAEINATLDLWFKGELSPLATLYRIAHVTGLNAGAK